MNAIEPRLIIGSVFTDRRGLLRYNNELNLSEFVRLYAITNSPSELLRGWHLHLHESKVFICTIGSVRIGAVEVLNPASPDKDAKVYSAELDSKSLNAFLVPAGYANAILTKSAESSVLVFSNKTLSESLTDDYRFPKEFWTL